MGNNCSREGEAALSERFNRKAHTPIPHPSKKRERKNIPIVFGKAQLHLDITPLSEPEGKRSCFVWFFSPQAALPALFPRKETFHTPLPLQPAKAEHSPYSSPPGALTVQGSRSKMQQLPTGPGTQTLGQQEFCNPCRSFHGKASRPFTETIPLSPARKS